MTIDECYEARKLAEQAFAADPTRQTAQDLEDAIDACEEAETDLLTRGHTRFGYPHYTH